MTTRPPEDHRQLPAEVALAETVAYQLEHDQPYGGPGGGGDADGDAD